MAKLIQICASENDLFALDDEGEVHQYNFNRRAWVKLVPGRSEDELPRGPEREHDGEDFLSRRSFGR